MPAACITPAARGKISMDRLTLVYHARPFDASGYGAAARAYIYALHRAGVEVEVRDVARQRQHVRDELVESLTSPPLNPDFHLFHGIPPEWAREAFRLPNAIGMTVWETDTMPTQWRSALNHVLETWLPCDYNVEAFRPQLSKPVFKLPHPMIPRLGRNRNGPDPDTFLGAEPGDFVIYSIFEWQDRKFPEGQLAAYLRAFPEGGPMLCRQVESGRQLSRPKGAGGARSQTSSRARVALRCEAWSEEQIEALHLRGDCYLSLHRGEGWAYPLFEAVCRGGGARGSDRAFWAA